MTIADEAPQQNNLLILRKQKKAAGILYPMC